MFIRHKKRFSLLIIFVVLIFLISLIVLEQTALLVNIFSVNPPKINYIKAKFLEYKNIGLSEKNAYVCVESKEDFKNLVVTNYDEFDIEFNIGKQYLKNNEYLKIEKYWKEYPEYFSFEPGESPRVLKCSYFESTNILNKVDNDRTHEIGRFNKSINTFSFNNLINFLIKAKIVPSVPTQGFNFSLDNYSSKTTRNKDNIKRVDSVVYSVFNDVPPFGSAQGGQMITYMVSLKDGTVFYTYANGFSDNSKDTE